MTRAGALKLLRGYKYEHPELDGYCEAFPKNGSKAKAMRWLGFAQGVLVALKVYTLDRVKEHSRNAG